MRPDQIQAHNRKVRVERAARDSRAALLEQGLRDHKNQLAELLTVALRPRAELKLNKLLEDHKIPGHDAVDGGGMFQALLAERGTTGLQEETDDHERRVAEMRDNHLPDGCPIKDFTDKVNELKRDHVAHLERPMTGEVLGKFVIRLMPKCNAAEGRALINRMRAGSGTPEADTLKDLSKVLKACTAIVKESQSR